MRRRVVVTGMGALCPLGTSLKEAWQAVKEGKCGISKLEGKEFESLPCKVAGLVKENGANFKLSDHFSRTELRSMGSATGYALLAAEEAIKDSKITELDEEAKKRIGVGVGMGMVDLPDICSTYEALNKGYNQISPFFVPRILPNMAAGHISIKYGFRGPIHSVSTACASGAHAIGDASRFIKTGDADLMVCGGTEACVSPLAIAAFSRLRALSTSFNDQPERASRPFDKKRDGFVMSEGSAILVLEELEHALRRNAHIYGEVLGYGLSGDASHLTAPRADGAGAILAMSRAIETAGLKVSDISYVNAHATSTHLGDAIEVRAIRTLFGEHAKDLAVSSTKGGHGHLLGGAGNLESCFTLKAIEEAVLIPSLNLEELDEGGLNFVKTLETWGASPRRIALKNSFGFGGTNASLCLGQFV